MTWPGASSIRFSRLPLGQVALIIWYAGGQAVLADHITLGTLMAFLSYLGMFYGPLSNLTHVSQTLNQFLTISQRMFEMLDEEPQKPVALTEAQRATRAARSSSTT